MSYKSEIEFTLNLLGTLNASKESTIFSPTSILNTLLISYAGANNETANQIAKVIGKDKTRDEIIDYYMTVFNNCKEDVDAATEEYQVKNDTRKRVKLSEEEDVKISMANKLFVNDKIILLSSYQKMMDEKFNGQIKQISFEDGKKVADVKIILFFETGFCETYISVLIMRKTLIRKKFCIDFDILN